MYTNKYALSFTRIICPKFTAAKVQWKWMDNISMMMLIPFVERKGLASLQPLSCSQEVTAWLVVRWHILGCNMTTGTLHKERGPDNILPWRLCNGIRPCSSLCKLCMWLARPHFYHRWRCDKSVYIIWSDHHWYLLISPASWLMLSIVSQSHMNQTLSLASGD